MSRIGGASTAGAVALAAAMVSGTASAATMVVGQVAPLSGPDADQGRDYAAGMQMLFRSVNRSGGVNGHTFTLVTKNDGGRAEDTLDLTRKLLVENQPLVLAGYIGGRNVSAVIRSGLLERSRMTLVGYRAAEVAPSNGQLFSVHASLDDELAKFIGHLATLGITRVGLLQEQGEGGAMVLAVAEDAARRRGVAIVSKASFEADTARVSVAIDVFIRDKPQAIVLVCGGLVATRFIERYREAGGGAQVFVYSGADIQRVTQKLAETRLSIVTSAMQGVVVAEVVPNPDKSSRIAQELREAAARDGRQESPLSAITMEGYIAAKAIVEAVRRQGASPTREGMAAALESLDGTDVGGYVLGFKPGVHVGSHIVDLGIITSAGKVQ